MITGSENRLRSISIGIPTYRGAQTLSRTVASVANSLSCFEKYHCEIILCVNGELEETLAVAEACCKQYPGLVQILTRKKPGKAGAMNYIAARASGEVLFFLDDDIILDLKCLDGCLRALSLPDPADLVWGEHAVLPIEEGSAARRFFYQSFTVPYRLPVYVEPESYVRGRCMAMLHQDYPILPEELINDDQFLHIYYWGRVRAVPGAKFYSYGVDSVYDYHQRFYRIAAGRQQMYQYFDPERVQRYERLVNRSFNWDNLRALPMLEKLHFLTWRAVDWSASCRFRRMKGKNQDWVRCSYDHQRH